MKLKEFGSPGMGGVLRAPIRSANDREMYLSREELNERETTQRVLQIYGTRDIVSTGLLTLGHLM